MNFNLMPFVIVGVALALTVITLFVCVKSSQATKTTPSTSWKTVLLCEANRR